MLVRQIVFLQNEPMAFEEEFKLTIAEGCCGTAVIGRPFVFFKC